MNAKNNNQSKQVSVTLPGELVEKLNKIKTDKNFKYFSESVVMCVGLGIETFENRQRIDELRNKPINETLMDIDAIVGEATTIIEEYREDENYDKIEEEGSPYENVNWDNEEQTPIENIKNAVETINSYKPGPLVMSQEAYKIIKEDIDKESSIEDITNYIFGDEANESKEQTEDANISLEQIEVEIEDIITKTCKYCEFHNKTNAGCICSFMTATPIHMNHCENYAYKPIPECKNWRIKANG